MTPEQLVALYQAKSLDLQAILDKTTLTGEDYAKAQALNTELDGIRGQVEAARAQADQFAQIKAAQMGRNAAMGAATLPAPLPGLNAPSTPGVLGMTSSGEIGHLTETKAGRELTLEGANLFTKSQIEHFGSQDYWDAFRTYCKGGTNALVGAQVKTLQEGSDGAGGFTVPEQVLRQLIEKKPTPTRLAGRVQLLQTGRDHLTIPRVIYNTDNLYTTGIRVTWTGEVPASSTAHRVTDPVFGEITIPIWTAMLSCPITNNLIEDSMFNLSNWLATKFGQTRDLLFDNMILNGSGVGQPRGVLIAPSSSAGDEPVYQAGGDPITADAMVAAAWSMPEQYEDNLAWCFNKTNMGAYLAGLKDAEDRYLWSMGPQEGGLMKGIRRELLGYPVLFSGFSPDRATNACPATLADWSAYSLIERIGLSVVVLNEVYAEVNQKVLLGRLRVGGVTTESWAIRPVKQAAS
jgi:HK97 family phage major capsid protein